MTGGCPALMAAFAAYLRGIRCAASFGMIWTLPPVWVRQPASENGGKMLLPLPRFRGGRPSRMPSLLMVRNLCRASGGDVLRMPLLLTVRNLCRLSGGTFRLLIQRSA